MDSIYLGKGEHPQQILLKYANRHGLIAGATGTGKTLTLQGLAEGFSKAGVPVFIADVKGDLAGISQIGQPKDPLVKRAKDIKYDYVYAACPAIFWDIFGVKGHNVRVTVSEMGPLMLSRLLDLNDTQEGVLNVAFKAADAEGMLLLDLPDLRAMLAHVSENAKEYSAQYGNVSAASVAAIQRGLLTLETQGGAALFGEPALEIKDLMRTAPNGQGAVSVLTAETLMQNPKLYSTFMLWLLSELFEAMPEVGDLDKPKLVFFFDEAHLLFDEAPKALLEKVEQLVRLIRSKGVGVYFITQNPADIPPNILGQLSNRVQHALRAFTPQEQKGVKAAAQTFRANPKFKTETVITELGIGEALVSTLDEKGSPTIVERTLIKPPSSLVGAITPEQRTKIIHQSPVAGQYEEVINRESAYERLTKRATSNDNNEGGFWGSNTNTKTSAPRGRQPATAGQVATKLAGQVAGQVARTVGSQIGRQIVRGLFKSLLK